MGHCVVDVLCSGRCIDPCLFYRCYCACIVHSEFGFEVELH